MKVKRYNSTLARVHVQRTGITGLAVRVGALPYRFSGWVLDMGAWVRARVAAIDQRIFGGGPSMSQIDSDIDLRNTVRSGETVSEAAQRWQANTDFWMADAEKWRMLVVQHHELGSIERLYKWAFGGELGPCPVCEEARSGRGTT